MNDPNACHWCGGQATAAGTDCICTVETLQAKLDALRDQCEHLRVKATCYGDMVHGVTPALAEAGFPVEELTKDGNVGAISRAVEKLRDNMLALKAELHDCHAELDWAGKDGKAIMAKYERLKSQFRAFAAAHDNPAEIGYAEICIREAEGAKE